MFHLKPTTGEPSATLFPLSLSSLELSDTQVYESGIRAPFGTAAHFCEEVVLNLPLSPFLPPSLSLSRFLSLAPSQCVSPAGGGMLGQSLEPGRLARRIARRARPGLLLLPYYSRPRNE